MKRKYRHRTGQFSHSRPTLILKGEADPVSAGGQAEYILSNALTGPKALIEFPGLGHEFYLSNIGEDDSVWVLSGTIRFDPSRIPPGKIRAVEGTVSGRKLNEKLQIKIELPKDLIGRVEIHGYESRSALMTLTLAGMSSHSLRIRVRNHWI